MNQIVLTGRLVRDPELKQTNSGLSVCNFDLAVSRRFSKDETDFIKCVAWRQTAEFVSKWFSKGSGILVVGELHQKKFTDKDGNNRTDYEVGVNDAEFFGSKSDNAAAPSGEQKKSAPKQESKPTQEEDEEEELPF